MCHVIRMPDTQPSIPHRSVPGAAGTHIRRDPVARVLPELITQPEWLVVIMLETSRLVV
jgi:hypothetical protein